MKKIYYILPLLIASLFIGYFQIKNEAKSMNDKLRVENDEIRQAKEKAANKASIDKKGVMQPKKITNTIIKNQHTGYLENTFTESIENYEIIQKGEFDFINIEGYEKLYEKENKQTPIVPVKRFTISIPIKSKIIDVKIVKNEATDLGTLNLPVICSGPPRLCEKEFFSIPTTMGRFDQLYSFFDYDDQNYKNLVIDLFPIEFDAQTHQTKLYKNVDIIATYTSPQSGILLKSVFEKVDDKVKIDVKIKNVIEKPADFIVDVIEGGSESKRVTVESGDTKEVSFEINNLIGRWAGISLKENSVEIGWDHDLVD